MYERNTGELKIIGAETGEHTVPADILAHMLQRLQRLVLACAASHDGDELKRRFNPSSDLRKRHEIRCGISEAGSYALKISEVDHRSQRTLPQNGDRFSALEMFNDFASAVHNGNHERIRNSIPSSRFQSLLFNGLHDLSPSQSDRWAIDITVGKRPPLRLTYETRRSVKRLQREEQSIQEDGTVIGELKSIDFSARTIVIRHPTTQHTINCSYYDEIEPDLWESRRELVQVTGQVSKNTEKHVTDISDVKLIEPVDFTEFEIEKFISGDRFFRLDPGILVIPKLDEDTKQVFVFSDEELDLHVAAYTIEELYDEIINDLTFAFDEYAKADDADLSPSAIQFKRALNGRIREES